MREREQALDAQTLKDVADDRGKTPAEVAAHCGVSESVFWRMNRKQNVRRKTRRCVLAFLELTDAQYTALRPCHRSHEFAPDDGLDTDE